MVRRESIFFESMFHAFFMKLQTKLVRRVSANQPSSLSPPPPRPLRSFPPPSPSLSLSFPPVPKRVRSTGVREINGFSVASTLPSTCARPARALFYHLSRRSRAHDRCSVGERGWEGGGGCTLRRKLATRRAVVGGGGRGGREARRQGEGRQKGENDGERRRSPG